ncbi:hypothetical protein BHE74_00030817 [Ensete ventricosum]|nr:hypothetical protein GW17_00045943 [Ensete ventricosum]RWW62073.1 hypothetical protein BHE74_00030817 [Ensete ventricosum]RZR99915.1 hypothetical protein BHM03_00029531 [Ensete ventricosum]
MQWTAHVELMDRMSYEESYARLNSIKFNGPSELRGVVICSRKREELMQLKLSDLEKIGLTSKQVHDMFRRTAREIFS